MGQFVHGWKRNAGFVALATACAIAACWFRSDSVSDTISLPLSGSTYVQVVSCNERLVFSHVSITAADNQVKDRLPFWMADSSRSIPEKYPQWKCLQLGGGSCWRMRPKIGTERFTIYDVRILCSECKFSTREYRAEFCCMGFQEWWIVLSLTLLSAWLLLGRSRQPKPTKDMSD